MSNASMPFVAVIGGLWQLDQQTAALAIDAGKAIGAELAKSGFGLVVYFSDDRSLEPHVVSGYVPSLNDGIGKIHVRYAESQRGTVKFKEETTRPELFTHRLFPSQDWAAPFYRSLIEEEGVDAVLLLGGATSTFIAGQIAIARRLPILAVDEFGGAAAKIWNELAQIKQYHSWGTLPINTFVEQLKSECLAGAARRKDVQHREQLLSTIMSHRYQAIYTAVAFFVLIITFLFGIVCPPSPAAYPFNMFSGLISAGATGALVRILLGGHEDSDPRTSLLLGSIAGFVVGLAYLIPQWVGAPGPLAAKSEGISPTDKIQFASSVLVALSAGIGFDTVFNRLQKQAQDAAVGPPK